MERRDALRCQVEETGDLGEVLCVGIVVAGRDAPAPWSRALGRAGIEAGEVRRQRSVGEHAAESSIPDSEPPAAAAESCSTAPGALRGARWPASS